MIMANECLVTKLKGAVNNEALPKFDMITFHVNGAKNTTVSFSYSNEIGAISNDYEIGSGVIANFTPADYPKLSGEGYVRVKDKYNITSIFLAGGYKEDKITPVFSMDISQLSYTNLTKISSFAAQSFNITNLKDLQVLKPTLTSISLSEKDSILNQFSLSGDISDLAKFVNLQTLSLSYVSDRVRGTMEQVATLFPRLTSLGDLTRVSWLTGSIESFVAVRRSQGVTEGSVSTRWGSTAKNITFNGEKLKGGDNTPFSWTANTITYSGVTINA